MSSSGSGVMRPVFLGMMVFLLMAFGVACRHLDGAGSPSPVPVSPPVMMIPDSDGDGVSGETEMSSTAPPVGGGHETAPASRPQHGSISHSVSSTVGGSMALPEITLGGASSAGLDSYSVQIKASEHLVIPGPPGEMRVWIGAASHVPAAEPGMRLRNESLGTTGETAKVTPSARGIDVKPEDGAGDCIKVDPSGSEVRFQLIPKRQGTFDVGADVKLYSSDDCTGVPVPKSAHSVKVQVDVSIDGTLWERVKELMDKTWTAFLSLWDKALLLLSGSLLFLLRKKLLAWFGFKSEA